MKLITHAILRNGRDSHLGGRRRLPDGRRKCDRSKRPLADDKPIRAAHSRLSLAGHYCTAP